MCPSWGEQSQVGVPMQPQPLASLVLSRMLQGIHIKFFLSVRGSMKLVWAVFAAALLPVYGAAQTPLRYDVHYTAAAPTMDGRLQDPAWKQSEWTSDFVDIIGSGGAAPRYRTRMKMLWDAKNLYIAAEMQEPNVHATLTKHDAVIFHDDDFEFFLKPVTDGEPYYEFEINALNATWDLYLNKPYRMGGKADSSWEATGVRTAVAVQGTLNDASDTDQGWTVEIALPLTAFASRQTVPLPVDGTVWRANFSRVEWLSDHPREDNWVWSPQGAVNMHIPERWGYLTFRK